MTCLQQSIHSLATRKHDILVTIWTVTLLEALRLFFLLQEKGIFIEHSFFEKKKKVISATSDVNFSMVSISATEQNGL